MSRRVVVTGMGAMTPLALILEETWKELLAGRSGVGPITQFDASQSPSRIAGEIKGFNPEKYIDRKEARRMARCSQVSVAVAQAALTDAGLDLPLTDGNRAGVLLGTAVGGFELSVDVVDDHRAKGWGRVNPFTAIGMLLNMPSHHVSCLAGATGPISTEVAACASGTQAVGQAADLIRLGAADVMICGGVEALIHFAPITSFCAMRALSTRNDEPQKASRPFDADRDGFVYSEGCAMLVLESLGHARGRGAHVRAEVLGHASSSDAYHVAQPHPEGRGAIQAMRRALDDARLRPSDVDYVNAHGTSTPINDAVETKAIKEV
ncbi:MAG: beta-ketoacyl-ACP synthase II, partial [Anaerolineae bacterium]